MNESLGGIKETILFEGKKITSIEFTNVGFV